MKAEEDSIWGGGTRGEDRQTDRKKVKGWRWTHTRRQRTRNPMASASYILEKPRLQELQVTTELYFLVLSFGHVSTSHE